MPCISCLRFCKGKPYKKIRETLIAGYPPFSVISLTRCRFTVGGGHMSAQQSKISHLGLQRESQLFRVLVIDSNEADQKISTRDIRRAWRTGWLAAARAVMKIVTVGQLR